MEMLRCHVNIYLHNHQSKFIYYLNSFAVNYLKLLIFVFEKYYSKLAIILFSQEEEALCHQSFIN